MKILVAADIFGETEDLRSLARSLDDHFLIVSPHAEPQARFTREAQAYAAFQAGGGLDAYVADLARALRRYRPDALVGFSAGATAAWIASADPACRNLRLAILFYGSRIRDFRHLRPCCPVRLYFAEHEEAFDAGRLARELAAAGMETEIFVGCRHGFMNPLSPGYDADARQVGLDLARSALTSVFPEVEPSTPVTGHRPLLPGTPHLERTGMPRCHLDHLAITAPCLEAGVEFVRRSLGVSPQVGGAHPRMGTHNHLLKLGERLYLEVIAVDPQAPRPNRPRWFRLDAPDPAQPIRLAAWIARTDDIQAAAGASPVPLGRVEAMSRGPLSWLITIPADGSLPLDGLAPTLIQWSAGGHPADMLKDSGCSLVRLEGFHPEAPKVDSVLAALGFEGEFRASPLPPGHTPYLVAHIRTPAGLRELRSSGADTRQPG